MSQSLREWLVDFGVSLVIHIALIALLAVSLMTWDEPPPPTTASEPIPARAVDSREVEAQLDRMRAEEQAKRNAELERQRKIEEQKREAERQRQAEIERKKALERKAAEEAKRKELERQRIAKQKAEEERQRQQEAERKRQAELEKQRQIEQERQRKLEQEKRRQEEEARKRKEAEAKARAEAERQLREQMEAEHQRMLDIARNEYAGLIAGKVKRNWLRPTGSPSDFSCKIRVTQAPGGFVVGVTIMESCGSEALDRSVETAVRKSEPLPKPPTDEVFEREIIFNFVP